jgi:hypothetical protein
MNRDDRLRAVEADLDARLRAAANALREASGTQVDAAIGLREILHTTQALADPPPEPTGATTAPRRSPRSELLRRSQRVALAVNLLLVVVLGALVVRVATLDRESAATSPTASTAPTAAATPSTTRPQMRTVASVPPACIDAADLADEVISKLDRNDRGQRLFSALRDYTIASQACRKAAASP